MLAKARMIYTTELMRKGWSNTEIVKHLVEKYEICETSARNSITKAYNWLKDNDASGYVENVRRKQVERSEHLLQRALDEGRLDVANKVIDTLNKVLGLYETKQKVEIVGDEINFKFGSTDNKVDNNDVSE